VRGGDPGAGAFSDMETVILLGPGPKA
jgi:hypothetical protein